MRIPNVIKIMSLFGVLITSTLLSACGSGGVNLSITKGSGNIVTDTRQVSGISAVVLDTSGDLTVSQGESESLTIETDDNILPLLTSDVTNGVLKLDTKPGSGLTPSKSIKYILVVKNLNALTDNSSGSISTQDLNLTNPVTISVDGSGNVSLTNIQSGDVTIKLSGSGSLNIAALKSEKVSISIDGSGGASISSVDTQTLSASLNGNGSLEVSGTTADQTINISGSGKYDGEKLASKTAVVKTDGSGGATVQVSDKLNATISGSGDITYIGNPTVTQEDDGSGKITQKS